MSKKISTKPSRKPKGVKNPDRRNGKAWKKNKWKKNKETS